MLIAFGRTLNQAGIGGVFLPSVLTKNRRRVRISQAGFRKFGHGTPSVGSAGADGLGFRLRAASWFRTSTVMEKPIAA